MTYAIIWNRKKYEMINLEKCMKMLIYKEKCTMKKYFLPRNGNFYKANLHCHSTLSDGRKTPEEIKEIYQNKGYSVVAYTDHDILISHNELTDDNFLALNGFEVEINEDKEADWCNIECCHICFISLTEDNITHPLWHRSLYLFGNAPKYRDDVRFYENEPDYVRHYDCNTITDMMKKGREKGFFVTYNHPTWSQENYEDYIGYDGMNAMEMFNGSCMAEGYEDYNPRVYDDTLRAGKKIYCIGADDNHNGYEMHSRRSDSGWAYTMIKTDKLEYRAITKALENGEFYASEGPEIFELYYEDEKVYIKCSEADRIICNYQIRKAEIVLSENGIPVTEACFNAPSNCGYFRITVIDRHGKHACTNAYFIE